MIQIELSRLSLTFGSFIFIHIINKLHKMKIIITRAETTSDWDSVAFCLIQLPNDFGGLVNFSQDILKRSFGNYSMTAPSFYFSSFIMLTEDICESLSEELSEVVDACKELSKDNELDFVEIFNQDTLDLDFSEFLPEAENFDACTISIDEDDFSVKCYGKHSGDEFSSFNISIKSIL